jgi:hypothetical protein
MKTRRLYQVIGVCSALAILPASKATDEITGPLGCPVSIYPCEYLECLCERAGGNFEAAYSENDPDDGYCICELDDGVVFCADGTCRSYVHGMPVDAGTRMHDGQVMTESECQSLWCRLRAFVSRQQDERITELQYEYAYRGPAFADLVLQLEVSIPIIPIEGISVVDPDMNIVDADMSIIEGGDHANPTQEATTDNVDDFVVTTDPGVGVLLPDTGTASPAEELAAICESDHDGDGLADGRLEYGGDGSWACCQDGYGCFECDADYACAMFCDTDACSIQQGLIGDANAEMYTIDWHTLNDSGPVLLEVEDSFREDAELLPEVADERSEGHRSRLPARRGGRTR